MNSSRLAELERQRALVREHLAWLEREIARERSATSEASGEALAGRPSADVLVRPNAPVPIAQSSSKFAADAATEPAEHASAFDEYQPDPKNAAESARRGCLIAAVAALVLLAAALFSLYFYRYRDRPILFPSPAAQSLSK